MLLAPNGLCLMQMILLRNKWPGLHRPIVLVMPHTICKCYMGRLEKGLYFYNIYST